MKKLFVGGLSADTTEEALTNLFSQHGTVRSIKLAKDIFSNHCKGFGFIEMEGHEARLAISELNGKTFNGKVLSVKFENAKKAGRGRRR